MSEMTTRQRASSILSAAKMRMLEDAGITVISREERYKWQADKARMERLERLYQAVNAWLSSDETESANGMVLALITVNELEATENDNPQP